MGIRVDGAAATTSTATKTSLETEVSSRCFKLHRAALNFIALILSRSIRQCWQILLDLNSKGLCRRPGE